MAPPGSSVGGSSFGGSVASSASADSRRKRSTKDNTGRGDDDFIDRRSSLENGVFGVLFTLSKESSETRIRVKWILLKILLDGWQLFTTVIEPELQGWDINPTGRVWPIFNVLSFNWVADLGYSAYLALLYSMVILLGTNVGLCVWVAWCFKEQKFPVVWPIKVLQVFTAFFFHAFDVASLNMLQLGISCRYLGPSPKMHFDLLPQYSCAAFPHMIHAIVSALSLVLFVVIAMLLNMAEVEVNPLSRRPFALGHSGSEVTAFGIKVLLTLVNVFFPWPRVVCCLYLVLSVALAWQYLRHPGHLVAWVNDLKTGVAITIVWCSAAGVLLVFRPGVSATGMHAWSHAMTALMLAGMVPAFGVGILWSRLATKRMTRIALDALANKRPDVPLQDVCDNLDDPRDVEVVARCCRNWTDRYHVAPEAIAKAQSVIKAGLAMFPSSSYMVLLHSNFMIDVLGVSQSGGRRMEVARKLNPDLMCRFIMFVRQQQATQKAAGHNANDGATMDLLGYVEYQRKQRMVVRLHQEALQAMCAFWLLSRIEGSVSQAQAAYRVVLEGYGSSPKLVRLYGKFLEGCKYDPWGAQEYYAEADRLEEVKSGIATGPLLPDGTPLSRMDDMAVGVLVINATGEVQMANKMAYTMFGYKRGTLDAKPLVMLLAPHSTRTLVDTLASLVAASSLAVGENAEDTLAGMQPDVVVVAMHYDRVAFSAKLSIRKSSGVGEDSTFITLWEPLPPVKGVATLWVAPNGDIAACDPQFVSITGWKASEVNGVNVSSLLSMPAGGGQAAAEESGTALVKQNGGSSGAEMVARLLSTAGDAAAGSLPCSCVHKFDDCPMACTAGIVRKADASVGLIHELCIRLTDADPPLMMVVNRTGAIKYASVDLVTSLRDNGASAAGTLRHAGAVGPLRGPGGGGGDQTALLGAVTSSTDQLAAYTLSDFLLPYWKELHVKLLKDGTATSSPSRSPLACRKDAGQGPTQELRTLGGKPLYMHVSVAAADMMGEMVHVVHMARSSLETCLSERRLRLTISSEGIITEVSKDTPASLFGLDPSQIIGRGLYEVVNESLQSDDTDVVKTGEGRAFAALVQRSLMYPGCSWRVQVAPPPQQPTGAAVPCNLSAAARMSRIKPAIMQVHMRDPLEGDTVDRAAELGVFVDLWPHACVSGVLAVDGQGRVTVVLEEATRPAGLLFGLPSQSLVGETLDALLELPAERCTPADLMVSSLGAKKSNLRTSKRSDVKVGPMHVLRGSHADGQGSVTLTVQLVGKPEPNEPATVLLRLHATPLAPAVLKSAPGVPTPPWVYPSHISASQRASAADTFAAAASMPRRLGAHDGAAAAAVANSSSRFVLKEASPPLLMHTPSAVRGADSMDIAMLSAPPPSLPAPPVLNPNGLVEGGLQMPAVTTSRGAEAASRGKLGGLVKSLGGDRSSTAGRQARPSGSHGSGLHAAAATAVAVPVLGDVLLPGSPQQAGGAGGLAQGLGQVQPVELREQAYINGHGDSATSFNIGDETGTSDASQVVSDDEELRAVPQGTLPRRTPKEAAGLTTAANDVGGEGVHKSMTGARGAARAAQEQDEDAASEGGTSNHSGTGGAEYKRGKRFRKLAKLLDSETAQQALQRLRVHALWVVGLLVIVHVVCFAMTTIAVQKQQRIMLAIGRAGQSQRFMHLIMMDARSLEVISRNMTVHSDILPDVYTAKSVPFLLKRITSSSDEIKVYNGMESNGTDRWTSTTVWDFITRFFSLARNLEETYLLWLEEGVQISSTFAVEFLLKSGPDLFDATRQVLNALLLDAVKNSKAVKQIQYIFLAVEGGAITCLAACYLAFLLRAVAIQRYKLYGTFLAVPVGLTRVLATDNINLLEDEDDEADDAEDNPIKEAAVADPLEAQAGGEEKPRPRRASVVSTNDVGLAERDAAGNIDDVAAAKKERYHTSLPQQQQQLLDDGQEGRGGYWHTFKSFLGGRRMLRASSMSGARASAASSGSKRSLKADSHDTAFLLAPFVVWAILVIVFYAVAVFKMEGVVDAVAVHSVVNFMSAGTSRAVFFSQLGADAYLAAGNDTERFPLVKIGVAHASAQLTSIFYDNGHCHRYPDLLDGTREIKDAHYSVVISLFSDISMFHVILFVILWIIFAAWIFVLLNPLCKRVAKERRRIAELLSQLPLELDVERLVCKALGGLVTTSSAGRRMSVDAAAVVA
ncbi:Tiny macrocysts protein B, partial [Tetrabaena socialis]